MRRTFWPRIAQALSRHTSAIIAVEPLSSSPPPSLTFDGALLERGELALYGKTAPLPDAPQFALQEADPLYCYGFHELGWWHAYVAGCNTTSREEMNRWLLRYLDYTHSWSSVFWDPYPTSSRVLNLTAAWLGGQVPASSISPHFLRCAFLLAGLMETHLQANHLLRNHVALAVARQLTASRLAARAWRGLLAEAHRQFGADGGHEERTPGYHLLAVHDLLVAYAVAPDSTRVALRAVVEPALGALEVMTHQDGSIAAFGDTAPRSLCRSIDLIAWARALGLAPASIAVRHETGWQRATLPVTGFSRLQAARLTTFVTHGPFGARYQPGHAHCDLFSFELDCDGVRVIVDPGVHAYHETEWRSLSRASAEHGTPSIAGLEQAELWSAFRCGYRPQVHCAAFETAADSLRFCGEATAFGPTKPRRMSRSMAFGVSRIDVVDQVDPSEQFSVALTLAPTVDANVRGTAVHLASSNGARLVIAVDVGHCSVEAAHVSHAFAERRPTTRVRLTSFGPKLAWSVEVAP